MEGERGGEGRCVRCFSPLGGVDAKAVYCSFWRECTVEVDEGEYLLVGWVVNGTCGIFLCLTSGPVQLFRCLKICTHRYARSCTSQRRTRVVCVGEER